MELATKNLTSFSFESCEAVLSLQTFLTNDGTFGKFIIYWYFYDMPKHVNIGEFDCYLFMFQILDGLITDDMSIEESYEFIRTVNKFKDECEYVFGEHWDDDKVIEEFEKFIDEYNANI